jgi:hypothetical protein
MVIVTTVRFTLLMTLANDVVTPERTVPPSCPRPPLPPLPDVAPPLLPPPDALVLPLFATFTGVDSSATVPLFCPVVESVLSAPELVFSPTNASRRKNDDDIEKIPPLLATFLVLTFNDSFSPTADATGGAIAISAENTTAANTKLETESRICVVILNFDDCS